MLTDFDSSNWSVFYDALSKRGVMKTCDCLARFRVDDGVPVVYMTESANPLDPFGESDVETVSAMAVAYLRNWWVSQSECGDHPRD